MEFSNALTWSVVNRLLTTGALLAGGLFVVVGFVWGFWGSIELLLEDPLNPNDAIAAANPILTLAFALVGFVVWQFGKTYALFRTLPRASGRAAAREFDHERVKSEILDGIDGRLTKIEDDVAETKRSVHELKRAEHADALSLDGVSTPVRTNESEPNAAEPGGGVSPATDGDATADSISGDTSTGREGPEPETFETGVPPEERGTASVEETTPDEGTTRSAEVPEPDEGTTVPGKVTMPNDRKPRGGERTTAPDEGTMRSEETTAPDDREPPTTNRRERSTDRGDVSAAGSATGSEHEGEFTFGDPAFLSDRNDSPSGAGVDSDVTADDVDSGERSGAADDIVPNEPDDQPDDEDERRVDRSAGDGATDSGNDPLA